MDDFEQFLQQQPIRNVPAEWRGEMLGKAAATAAIEPWWLAWLWPSPLAWTAVAGVWVLIIALTIAARPPRDFADGQSIKAADLAQGLAEQRRLLAELSELEPVPPQQPPHNPGPHSELMFNFEKHRHA